MSRFFARLAISIAALLVMLVAACIATGYFAYALHLFLSQYISPPLAAVATGAILLLLAAILAAATQWGSRRPRSYPLQSTREVRESAAELGGELGRRLQGLAEAHKAGALFAALAAGFAVGVSPKLRDFLLDILKK
jgi:hypothetical protein